MRWALDGIYIDRPQDAPHDCTFAIWQDQTEMAIIVDHVADLVVHQSFRSGAEGRLLAEAVARLVNAVDLVTMRVARLDGSHRPAPNTREKP